jgi:serine/threonine protein kinase
MRLSGPQLSEVDRVLYRKGFTLGEDLGGGGYASVYSVESHKYRDAPRFALKLIDRSLEDESLMESFTAEIAALEVLVHPNVIQFYDFFRSDSFLYLVLEYCPGGSMKDIVEAHGAIAIPTFRKYAAELVAALHYCHNQKVAHRDIKSSNILIDRYGRAKLADFGLAVLMARQELIESYCGSLAYLAPEILLKQPFDPMAADIWGLGVTLYEMVMGVLPWASKDIERTKEDIINARFVMPTVLPRDIAAALDSMLVGDPGKRVTAEALVKMSAFQDVARIPVVGSGSIPRIGRMGALTGGRGPLVHSQTVPKRRVNGPGLASSASSTFPLPPSEY